MKYNEKGFTIVELVIVIAVIAVLAAVLIPTFSGIVEKANKSAALQEVKNAYTEALANALYTDGTIEANEEADGGNGFTFVFTTTDGKNANVTDKPDGFKYSTVAIQDGKIVLDGEIANPGGNTPPAQGGENEGEGGNNEPQQPQTVPVESVTLDQTTLTLTEGDNATLTATVNPGNATIQTVTWTSNAECVATVSGGVVTAVAEGTATITATADGKTATCEVTVNAAVVTPTVYTVTKTGAAITGADTVNQGEAYSATITLPEHYNSVTVTMGGTDITATAYSEGAVTIASVTGDIEITVSAAVNLSNPTDANWKTNYRISSSSGEQNFSGWTVTNFIPLQKGDTVYVKNFNMYTTASQCSALYPSTDNPLNGHVKAATLEYGKNNDVYENVVYANDAEGIEWTQFTVTFSGTYSYMRLCGQLTGAASDVEIHILRDGEWITAQ